MGRAALRSFFNSSSCSGASLLLGLDLLFGLVGFFTFALEARLGAAWPLGEAFALAACLGLALPLGLAFAADSAAESFDEGVNSFGIGISLFTTIFR